MVALVSHNHRAVPDDKCHKQNSDYSIGPEGGEQGCEVVQNRPHQSGCVGVEWKLPCTTEYESSGEFASFSALYIYQLDSLGMYIDKRVYTN